MRFSVACFVLGTLVAWSTPESSMASPWKIDNPTQNELVANVGDLVPAGTASANESQVRVKLLKSDGQGNWVTVKNEVIDIGEGGIWDVNFGPPSNGFYKVELHKVSSPAGLKDSVEFTVTDPPMD